LNILVMVCSFPPEISPGRLEFELSEALTNAGHKVDVVTAFPRRYLLRSALKHKGLFSYKEQMGSLKVLKMGPEFSDRDNLFSRGFEYFFDFLLFSLGGLFFSTKIDVIVCSSPPMTIGLAGYFLARIRRKPMILRIGDIHPQALIDLGLVKSKPVIFLLKIIERILYQKVDHIIVLSDKYKQDLVSKGTDAKKITVVSNWVDSKEILRLEKVNTFRKDLKLSNEFIVTYAGTMSWPQDLETVIEAASMLSNCNGVKFVLAGDGPKRKSLEIKIQELGLKNIIFLPLQARERYVNIIQASDACLVCLKKDFKSPSVPTKLLDIMACGRPVIANVPLDGDAPKIVNAAKCGFWVEPENAKDLCRAILSLRDNAEERKIMGLNSRKYFNAHFSLDSCMRSYERIFLKEVDKKLSA
jgi:colanic acid biosynthesis glycosyl transferase WcaI